MVGGVDAKGMRSARRQPHREGLNNSSAFLATSTSWLYRVSCNSSKTRRVLLYSPYRFGLNPLAGKRDEQSAHPICATETLPSFQLRFAKRARPSRRMNGQPDSALESRQFDMGKQFIQLDLVAALNRLFKHFAIEVRRKGFDEVAHEAA